MKRIAFLIAVMLVVTRGGALELGLRRRGSSGYSLCILHKILI